MIARRSGAVQRLRAGAGASGRVRRPIRGARIRGQTCARRPLSVWAPRSVARLAPGDRYRPQRPDPRSESRPGTLGPTRSPFRAGSSVPALPGPSLLSTNRRGQGPSDVPERGQSRPSIPRAGFWPPQRPGDRADHRRGCVGSSGGQMHAMKTRGRVGRRSGAVPWTPTSSARAQRGSHGDGREIQDARNSPPRCPEDRVACIWPCWPPRRRPQPRQASRGGVIRRSPTIAGPS